MENKTKNRIISFASIAIFAIAIFGLVFTGYKVVNLMQENQKLIAQRDEIIKEKNAQDEIIKDKDYQTIYNRDQEEIKDDTSKIVTIKY
jgi:cell division protein FtsL